MVSSTIIVNVKFQHGDTVLTYACNRNDTLQEALDDVRRNTGTFD